MKFTKEESLGFQIKVAEGQASMDRELTRAANVPGRATA